jgi:hypothetical protein
VLFNANTVEAKIYEVCAQQRLDYVGPDNVRDCAVGAFKDYCIRKREQHHPIETYKTKSQQDEVIELTDDLTCEVTLDEIAAILSTSVK